MEARTVLHYEVLRPIGSGGMGVVYLARDQRLGRTVALKLLSNILSNDADAKTRLVREARTASALDHVNIATIYDIEEMGDGSLVLAMAYYEGRTLADLIAGGPLPVNDAIQYAAQMADGLAEAHRAGIIHCDIKPANVLVTSRGVVKILDFGIARMTQQSLVTTAPETVMGTLPYMSPEQLDRRPIDHRTDLWSLGVVLYEMLSGQRPFIGDAVSMVAGIVGQTPPSITARRPEVPKYVETLLAKALAKPVESRLESAEQFALSLRTPHPIPKSRPAATTRLIVLPFKLLRADPEIEFLSFSLSDAITASLIGLESLQVRSSAVAARMTSDDVDVTAIGRQADVDLLLRGTLVRAGAKVRVQAQLVEAATGNALWSLTSDVLMGDLFGLQDEFTQRIVSGLTAPLSAHDQRRLGRDVPADPVVFEEYLRANQLAQHVGQWPAARTLYERCLERDPRYAPAWARLGRLYWLMGKYVVADASENRARAIAAFETALKLNPDLALAHHLFTPFQVDAGQAQEAMVRLLALATNSGNDAEVYAGLVHACRYCGLLEASLRADAVARAIDRRIQTSAIHTRFQLGEYALVALQDINEFPIIVSTSLMIEGRPSEATQRLGSVDSSNHRLRNLIVAVHALAEGRMEDSRDAIRRSLAEPFHGPEELYHLSRLLSQTGAVEESIGVLERAIDGGFFSVRSLNRDPWLAPLRSHDRYQRAMVRAQGRHESARIAFSGAGGSALLDLQP